MFQPTSLLKSSGPRPLNLPPKPPPKYPRFIPMDTGSAPYDREELYDKIRMYNVPCSCPEHCEGYKCTRNHHDTIIISRHGNILRPKGKTYEAMHLVNASVQYFTRPASEMSDEQKLAIQDFRALAQNEPFLWQRLDMVPGKGWISHGDMEGILHLFNEIFFFGALVIGFEWRDMEMRSLLGSYSMKKRCVRMNSMARSSDMCEDTRLTRWEILLQECVHALLHQFACNHCESYGVNVENARGHGRAFQVLSGAVFEGARLLLGIPALPVSFTTGFGGNWEDVRYMPSMHDMELWPDYHKVGMVVKGSGENSRRVVYVEPEMKEEFEEEIVGFGEGEDYVYDSHGITCAKHVMVLEVWVVLVLVILALLWYLM